MQKCFKCKKKSFVNFECKCNNLFCLKCLPFFEHKCNYDYKENKQNNLKDENVKISKSKVDYI